jgi:hypothetical protein
VSFSANCYIIRFFSKGKREVDFKAEEAMKIAKSLSFPRLVGSPGEEKAASLIEKKLIDAGYHPQREEFMIPLTPWTMMKGFVFLAILISILARGLSTFSSMSAGIFMLLMVAFLAFYPSFWMKFGGSEFPFPWLRGRKKKEGLLVSQNVVASLPAYEKAEQYLYLIAHYDSKSQSLSLPHRAFSLLLAGLASLWVGFIYLWTPGERLSFFPSWEVDFPLALAFLGMITLLFLRTGNRSAGGLDNAGSLGVLLHLAEALKQKRTFRSQVIFLFSGAEELGLQGAFAYLQKHRKEIEKEKSYFVNLDCVGVKGRTRIFSRKGFFPVGKESFFVSRLKEIGKPFKIGLWSFSFGFLMDHQAIMEKGYQAVTLACPSKKILKVHTADDTAAHLEKEGMEEVGKFILAWIESFEKGRDLDKTGTVK